MKSIRAFYNGKVQGVGFRYSVHTLAKGYEVSGWVKNLPDGRVEILASGNEREVDEFFEAIRDSHLAGPIEGEEFSSVSPRDLKGFRIVD